MTTPVCENKLQPEKQSPTDDSTTSTETSTVVLTEGRRLKFLRDALGMTIAKCISAGKYVHSVDGVTLALSQTVLVTHCLTRSRVELII